jgi:hypothetical protein
MNESNKEIITGTTPVKRGNCWCLNNLRKWVWELVNKHLVDGFGEEASAWFKWKICDYIFAFMLLYLAKRIRSSRAKRFVDFLLEN